MPKAAARPTSKRTAPAARPAPRASAKSSKPAAKSRGKTNAEAKPKRKLGAKYDAAQHTDENKNHWAQTDRLSANAAHNKGVRQTLRDRSRYECQNNSYLGGVVSTQATDLVGTGPRLQLTLPGVDRKVARQLARQVERSFAAWSRAVCFASKLWLMDVARRRDGESFALLVNNPGLRHKVKLDLRLYEAEQVDDPFNFGLDPKNLDGIFFDDFGNVLRYRFLRSHPGGLGLHTMAYDDFDAQHVVHWFRPTRPGQCRGVPETAAALPLCSQLRRYTLATLTAAEFAAMLAGVMYTKTPAEDGGEVEVEAMQEVPMVRGTLIALPNEWEAEQFDPKQPTGNYGDFKRELLNEAGRGMGVPLNIITGNSSGYNFSSGRLDHLPYQRGVRVERNDKRARVVDPIFLAWVDEAALAGELPPGMPPIETWSWEWYWDGFESIDPKADADATQVMLATKQTTLAQVYAEKGLDWEEQLHQIAREAELMRELGIDPATAYAAAAAAPAAPAVKPAGHPPTPAPAATPPAAQEVARA